MQDTNDTLGPLDLAIIGALEKLAQEHSAAARLADQAGDKAHRKAERAAATAFTNALIEFRRGVRPDVLPGGARIIPSRRPGEAPHLITMDGDWVCSCAAHANIHWPIALVIGIEVALDMLADHDDGDVAIEESTPAELGRRLAEARSRLYMEAA